MGLGRILRAAGAGRGLDVQVVPSVAAAELAPLVEDYQARLSKVSSLDVREETAAKFAEGGTVKAVCRSPGGALEGAALLAVEGSATDIVFLHILPRHATDEATGALLDALMGALPEGTTKVRAQVANSGQWLHLSPARARALLEARGFTRWSRVLMLRDLRKPLPPVPPVPAGYVEVTPEPTKFEEWTRFAVEAYRGTTDYAVITLEESQEAYLRLYTRFLGGEFGTYARGMSFAVAPEGGGQPVGVLHTILVGKDPYVGDLSVLPGHRGKGIGKYLLLRALASYAASGATRAGLTATEQNRTAYSLYRSAGFAVARATDIFVKRT